MARVGQEGDFIYFNNGDHVLVEGYVGPGGAVVIPDRLFDLPVAGIGSRAFASRTNLTSVTIPPSVTGVAQGAFSGCTGLTNLTIPDGLVILGIGAFSGCTSLMSVTIPQSIRAIPFNAFSGCIGLRSVTIPNGVESIGFYAFSGCWSLTNVAIPERVSFIGFDAFAGCTNLTAIDVDPLNGSFSSSGGVVFDKLQSALLICPEGKAGAYVIPNSVRRIGATEFLRAFSRCGRLTNVAIPDGVTNIARSAFSDCTGLKSLSIPDSVVFLGEYAFTGCTGLTDATIGRGVTSLPIGAFDQCTGLRSVTIPAGITNIGDYAFRGCIGLASVYFEGHAPSVGLPMFGGISLATIFYRAGATGWGPTFAGGPTAVWTPRPPFGDWAISTGLTNRYPNASAEGDDPDGDGMTNGAEWFAGTDPTQAASRFAMEPTARTADLTAADQTPINSDLHAVYFRSVPGRYYGVERASSLAGPWRLEATAFASTTQKRFVVRRFGAQRFYRVQVFP